MSGHLGKYELLRVLGIGGMGEVLLARQSGPAGFKKLVVVKKILESFSADPAMVKMFQHEATTIAGLSHPNIVQVLELGEHAGQFFIAMEYVHGQTLRTLMKHAKKAQQPIPPVTAALILAQVLRGLQHAHSALSDEGQPLNLVHRDVTPDNIMVGYDGVVKLLDFGIAKIEGDSAEKTAAGVVKGKVPYLSPEQIFGEPITARTDLYAAGVVLYEVLAGERPFVGATDAAMMHQVIECEPTPLSTRLPSLPPVLNELVARAMAKKPEQRIASAEAFAAALEDWAASARDTSPGTSISDYLARHFDAAARRHPSFSSIPAALATPLRSQLDHVTSTAVAPPPGERPWWQRRQGLLAGAAAAVLAIALAVTFATRGAPEQAKPAPPVELADSPAVREPPKQPPKPEPVTAQAPELKPPEPKSAPAKPAPKISTAPGTVDLRVIPWGEVFEGTRRLGLTPMQPVTMSPGPHVLTIVNGDMNKKKDVRVLVRPGQVVALKVDLLE